MKGREKNMLHGNHSARVKNIQYLCDKFKGASVIYSLRRLRKDYTGPVIRVSNSTGTTVTDIGTKYDVITGFDYVDWSLIRQIYPTGIVYVTTWYDQSGNGFNSTNATIASCPQIQDTTAPVNQLGDNRNPFYNVNGFIGLASTGNRRLINASINLTTPITYFTVQAVAGDRKTGVIFDSYNNSQCVIYNTGTVEAPNYLYSIANGTNVRNTKEIKTQQNLTSGVLGGTQANMSVDYGYGNNVSQSTNNLNGLSLFNLRGNPNPLLTTYGWSGIINEIIIYHGNLQDKIELIRKQMLKDYKLYSVLNYR